MPAKKNKKSSLKKPTVKKTVKKIIAKKNTKVAKKTVVKKSLPQKLAKTSKSATKNKIVKKVTKKPSVTVVSKKSKPVKSTKVSKVVKSSNAASKKLEKSTKKPIKKEVKKIENKKADKKTEKKIEKKIDNKKHSLAKAILAKGSNKEKTVEPAKAEPAKSNDKKFESSKKIIVVRKAEDNAKINFKVGDYAIYPSHGVGKIISLEKTVIAGQDFSCYLMHFEREKLTIKIPANSAKKIGLRHPISKAEMDEVFSILRSGIKKLKGMWSRRAQEYETKINSGDIILLAEVIRDLTRDIEDADRSYSERIIYETAIYRLASEYAAIYKVELEEAKEKIVATAKDKLVSEARSASKDDFDDFDDFDSEKSEDDEDEESEDDDEEEEDEDDDFDFDDEDEDDAPRKKKRK